MPVALASYMSSNISKVGLNESGLIISKKAAIQSGGSLERCGVPTVARICALITGGIFHRGIGESDQVGSGFGSQDF